LNGSFFVNTVRPVPSDFDPRKHLKNLAERGIGFDRAADFDWAAALICKDDRKDYGEDRYVAIGPIGGRLHVLVFTPREGRPRVISLRKANERERTLYHGTG
jgi:uncharacterized protein